MEFRASNGNKVVLRGMSSGTPPTKRMEALDCNVLDLLKFDDKKKVSCNPTRFNFTLSLPFS